MSSIEKEWMFFMKKRRSTIILLVITALITLILKLPNIDIPLLEAHAFRQTQTAITVQTYIFEGLKFFDYQTPVLGSPWTIPFEFPIFQVSAYFIYKFLNLVMPMTVDLACRFTNLLYFYLSAVALYKLVNEIFEDINVSRYIILFYLINPFCMFWSRTAMIDYCSVLFTILYAAFFIKWIKSKCCNCFIFTILFGCLAYLSKSTTVITVVLLLAYYVIIYLIKLRKSPDIRMREIFINMLYIGCLIMIPLSVGVAWAKYSDYMKIISGQEWLTSKALFTWNFGSWNQKINIANWGIIFARIKKYFIPFAWMGIFFMPIINSVLSKKDMRLIVMSFGTILFSISVFFNLYYVHDYYLMALSPWISIVTGCGLYIFIELCKKYKRRMLLCFMVVILAISLIYPQNYWKHYYMSYNDYYSSSDILCVGKYINNITKRDDRILVMDNDWSSDILYYSQRKGYMVRNKNPQLKDEFSLVVLQDIDKHMDVLSKFSHLEYIDTIGRWKIYKPIK